MGRHQRSHLHGAPKPIRTRASYIAAATYGLGYVVLSVVAGAVAVFFQALPAALLAALAGLALLGTIMGGMAAAMANPSAAKPRSSRCWPRHLASVSGVSDRPSGAWWRACWPTPLSNTGAPARSSAEEGLPRLRGAAHGPQVWAAGHGVSGCTFMMRQGTCTKLEIQAAASSPSSITSMACSPTFML